MRDEAYIHIHITVNTRATSLHEYALCTVNIVMDIYVNVYQPLTKTFWCSSRQWTTTPVFGWPLLTRNCADMTSHSIIQTHELKPYCTL